MSTYHYKSNRDEIPETSMQRQTLNNKNQDSRPKHSGTKPKKKK